MKRLTHALWAKLLASCLLLVFAAGLILTGGAALLLADRHAYTDGGLSMLSSYFPDNSPSFQNNMRLAQSYFYEYLAQQENPLNFDPQWEERYLRAFHPESSNFYFGVYDMDGKLVFSGGSGQSLNADSTTDFEASRYLCMDSATLTASYNEHPVKETITFGSEQSLWTAVQEQYDRDDTYGFTYEITSSSGSTVTASFSYTQFDETIYRLVGYARENLSADDAIAREYHTLYLLIANRSLLIIAAVVCGVLCLVLFVFLMCAAGRSADTDGVRLSWFDRIPLDLLLILLISLGAIWFAVIEALNSAYVWSFALLAAVLSVSALIYTGLCLAFSMTLATRIKAGGWYRNTIICRVLTLVLRFLRWIWNGLVYICRNLPLYWRGGLIWVGLCLIDFCVFARYFRYNTMLPVLWVMKMLVFTALAAFALIAGKRLLDGGRRLASGDLESKIDLKYLYFDFRHHAEDLNAIGSGMQKAVEQQMRSERLKTELITNVSHDIKTPLTSIVNYVDLLKKEHIESPQAQEYLDVLDRQSARLKKLTEDLVEASKASTGNLSCTLERTDVNVLLGQVLGEYEERLQKAGLEPILLMDEKNPQILADGRLLWRVFDNLLSNICKYAMAGTRVYLSSILANGHVTVTFKNISKYALNISPDELMERFVRGDSSRSTEGSGLGLSIANSLTTLQRGEFRLVVDGDLFKASVIFQQLNES